MVSPVMIAFKFAALSIYVPTSFSSTIMAVALVKGSNIKSLLISDNGIEAYVPFPHNFLMSSQSVPFPLFPDSE